MKKTRLLAVAAVAVALAGISPASASAGEVRGNGIPITIHANSICAFSGLEDHPVVPGTTQSWGSIPKASRDFLVSIGVSPATECNAHANPLK